MVGNTTRSGPPVHPKNLVAFDFWQFRKVVMPARLRLSWGMKTLKLFLLSVLGSLEFGWQAIRYALIFVSAFFRQRASLGCEIVAMRSQLTFCRVGGGALARWPPSAAQTARTIFS